MATLTQEHFDEKLERFATAIQQDLTGVHQEIASVRTELKADIAGVRQEILIVRTELKQDIANVQESLANLVTLVDKFTKIYTELNQELVVLRQHVRDMELRIEKLEVHAKAA
ncbi:MAG: hypothetical protein Q8O51_02055 [bacterium]|nr:hypothetical protein [bacterium]